MSTWVCSKWNDDPADREKWEVLTETPELYYAAKDSCASYTGWLPKSDYRVCDPPIWRWVDVTSKCTVREGLTISGRAIILDDSQGGAMTVCTIEDGYRLRKVQLLTNHICREDATDSVMGTQDAFIVERQKEETR